jgi:hypothetical protein
LATIPLVVLVVASYLAIGEADNHRVSTIKSLLGTAGYRHWRGFGLYPCVVLDGDNGPEVIEYDSTPPDRTILATVRFHDKPVYRRGPWAFWHESGGSYVEVSVEESSRIPADEAVTLYFTYWLNRIEYGDGYSAAQVREVNAYRLADWTARWWECGPPVPRILWLGVMHNIGIAVVLLALGMNLVALPRSICSRWVEARRGRCRSCGYPVAGLPGPVCPECGGRIE